MFYLYNQNNSGGRFLHNMPHYLLVEANSANEADSIAEANGVYFNGVANGIDCACCGDRWDTADPLDAKEIPYVYQEGDLAEYTEYIGQVIDPSSLRDRTYKVIYKTS